MKKITGALHKWGVWRLVIELDDGYSEESIMHRIAVDDLVFGIPPKDRILCRDPKASNETILINREWVKLPSLQKKSVFGKYALTNYVQEDGNVWTEKEVARILGFPLDTFQSSWGRGVKRINRKVGL